RLMSYKAALAGLPYGGAKAVLFADAKNADERSLLIKTYAQKINYLRGSFITGADVGVNEDDLKMMRKESKYIVGVSTDPVKFTVLGIYYSLQVCLREKFGTDSLQGRSFAIQGLGKTGYSLLKILYKDAAKIIVCDIDEKKVASVKKEFPNISVVSPSEIFKQKVDVYSPCALGNVFTANSVTTLKCKIIVGPANNQLATDKIGDIIFQKGILYAPDYVVNAGGLIAVVQEYEDPKVSDLKIAKKVLGIKKTMKLIVEQSKLQKVPTNRIADQMAEKIFNTYN